MHFEQASVWEPEIEQALQALRDQLGDAVDEIQYYTPLLDPGPAHQALCNLAESLMRAESATCKALHRIRWSQPAHDAECASPR